jgi:hypothetical protein
MNSVAGDGHPIPPTRNPRAMRSAEHGGPDINPRAARIQNLNEQAAVEYAPVVQGVLRSENRDVSWIEHTPDGLLDFCGHGPVLTLYRRLCRHYWIIDSTAAARYVQFYREMWDSESLTQLTDQSP